MKICRKCNQFKPESEFYSYSNTKDGLSYWCKSCKDTQGKKWARENKEKMVSYVMKHRHTENGMKQHREAQKRYRKTEKGKITTIKNYNQRERELGFNKITTNPFESNEEIVWHHIDNNNVVALPKDIHENYAGYSRIKHRENLQPIIKQIYGDDITKNEVYEEFELEAPLHEEEVKIDLSDCDDCENDYKLEKRTAVALIGDKFYKGAFLSAKELEKAHKGWENTLLDLNHMGTTDIRGFTATSNILYFVGYNDNVRYDEKTKSMIMDVHIVDKTHYASAWRGYIELCEKSGQTPNVSVSFRAKTKTVEVSELPEDVDYQAYGLRKEDRVSYIYDIEPQALSTVFRGACNDKDGCGIGMGQNQDEVHSEEGDDSVNEEERQKREEIISWLKEHENN